ncbi:MAG: hypothetical protein ACI4MK_02500 [Aristaeellaceae bacterium]
MKKPAAWILALLAVLTLRTAVAGTVTPMPPTLDTDSLACQAVMAVLTDVDPAARTVTLALYEPEVFAAEDILALQPGDVLISGGQEIAVASVNITSWGDVFLNEGTDAWFETLPRLEQDAGGNYRTVLYGTLPGWRLFGQMTFALPETLLLLDSIDPATGEALQLPTVHTCEQWLAMIAEEAKNEGVGFSIENMYLVFDENGVPAVAYRYHVPWQ